MATKAKLLPTNGVHFVVVSNPGTIFERIEDYCQKFTEALACKDCYDIPVDVMKVKPNGDLTTEF